VALQQPNIGITLAVLQIFLFFSLLAYLLFYSATHVSNNTQ